MRIPNPSTAFKRRLCLLGALFCAFLGLLLCRLWHVQVRQGLDHVSTIKRQSIRRIRLSPVRGCIFAGDGTVLVDNRPVYDVSFHLSEMRQPGPRAKTVEYILKQSNRLAAVLGRPSTFTADRLDRGLRYSPALPLTAFTDLGPEGLATAAELVPPIPGMEIVTRVARRYPLPGVGTHVLGFTGRSQPPDAFERKRYSYVARELRGRDGLELFHDDELSGEGGMRLVRVNSLGFVHGEIGSPMRPRAGKDLITTLIPAAQAAADAALTGHLGALVMLDIRTGAILAMASAPSYNLAALTGDLYAELRSFDYKRTPLRNRAVNASYTPGSILKPLIALAALENQVIKPGYTMECTGGHLIGTKRIRCWNYWAGHGMMDVVRALEVSCNPFFIEIGLATGLAGVRPVLASAGIGEKPALDLGAVGSGLLPSRAYAKAVLRQNWIAINTAYLSIGQGVITLSPLHAALFTAAIANDGRLMRPFIVRSVRSPDGYICRNTAPVVERQLLAHPEHLTWVRQGMWQAVNSENGTAKSVCNDYVTLAGKTGTAEVITPTSKHKDTWFIGYGPVEVPTFAIAVLVEHGESGGKTAAPVAKKFFEGWLGGAGDSP